MEARRYMPPTHKTISRDISEQLIRRITNGAYPIGSKLPTERLLAEEFGVGRHVIREALKRLDALGLVRIRQGSGIFVRDLELTAGIELFDVLLTGEDGEVNLKFLRDVLEFRDHTIQLVVRLAAARRTEEHVVQMRKLVKERRKALTDMRCLETVTTELYRVVADASDNHIFALMFNTMGRILFKLRREFDVPILGLEQAQDLLERIVEAIEQKDPDMAALLAMRHAGALRQALFADGTVGRSDFQQMP